MFSDEYKCKNCGYTPVAEDADRCPRCRKEQPADKVAKFFENIFGFIIVLVIFGMFSKCSH